MKIKKRYLCLIIGVFILSITMYYYRPVRLSEIMNDKDSSTLYITYLKGTEDVRNPGFKYEDYEFKRNSSEYKDIMELFKNYKYHVSLNTITNNTFINNVDYIIHIKNSKHSIMITDSGAITIDEKPYRVGYFSNKQSEKLTNKLLEIMKES